MPSGFHRIVHDPFDGHKRPHCPKPFANFLGTSWPTLMKVVAKIVGSFGGSLVMASISKPEERLTKVSIIYYIVVSLFFSIITPLITPIQALYNLL